MLTLEEICNALQGTQCMCKANTNQGYFQLASDENSHILTCFITHEGKHRFKRLTQSCSASGDAFKYITAENICSGPKVLRIMKTAFSFIAGKNKRCLNALPHSSNGVNKYRS